MYSTSNIPFNASYSIEYFIKPATEISELTAGVAGTRVIETQLGVKTGSKIAEYVLPTALIQKRPTDAIFKVGGATSFGGTSVSTQSWNLSKHFIFDKLAPSLVIDQLGLTADNLDNDPDALGLRIMNHLVSQYGQTWAMDTMRHSFWSKSNLNFAVDYTSSSFTSTTEDSLKENEGFVSKIKTAIAASEIVNKDVSGTGSSQNGTVLSADDAYALVEALVVQSGYLLQNYNKNMPLAYRPKIVLSNQWYYAFEAYLIGKGYGADNGFRIFGMGATGVIDTNKPIGINYRGFQVFNGYSVFDDYWVTHSITDANNQIMGMMVAPDNLSIGVNLDDGAGLNDVGLKLEKAVGAEKGGFYDLSAYTQHDFLIKDPSLISTVGFEKALTSL